MAPGHDIWEKARQTLIRKQGSAALTVEVLEKLGPEPGPPAPPVLLCGEPTLEGLTRIYREGRHSLGLFSSEGGQFLGGYSMGADHRLRTAASLSALWDGAPISRARAGDDRGGVSNLHGRRLALHLLVQPGIGEGLTLDRELQDQGFLSRLLISSPDSRIGMRMFRLVQEEDPRLAAYCNRLETLLQKAPLLDEYGSGLLPRRITLSPGAIRMFANYHDQVERRMAKGGEYESIRSFASKLPEHAARLAVVIAIFEDPNLDQLSEDAFGKGIIFAEYYAEEAMRLSGGRIDPQLLSAEKLLSWLRTRYKRGDVFRLQDIYQKGPTWLRTADKARLTVNILVEHGYLARVEESILGRDKQKRPEVYRIVGLGPC